MNETNQYYYQLTNYPHVFKKSYWGNFQMNENEHTMIHNMLEIIRNRNHFVEDFKFNALENYLY